ncbi:MAG: hypothetical protein ACTSVB_10230 [Candidatus Heimdallarchaeaceae archaeon]|nr:MAG: hypothetical protein DRN69_07885 [Candidatus Pacearchaeota archaeon]
MSFLKKLRKKSIDIAVIAVGDAACTIGAKFIQNLKENKINVKSLAINTKNNFESKISDPYSDKFWFAEQYSSTNRDLELAKKLFEERKEALTDKLKNVVFYRIDDKKREEKLALHLIIASGGGTGSAGSMIVSKIIKDITGESPTIIFIVPEKHEPSVVQYNTATALFYLGFDSLGPNCPTILFDNEKLISVDKTLNIKDALEYCNNYLANTLSTTILAALQESSHEEFNAGLNDFFKSFSSEAKGIGVIISVDKTFESLEKAQNIRFSDIFFKELELTSSLTADITKARLGFLSIIAPHSYQTTFETKKIVKRFEKGSIKVSLTSLEEPILLIRGVITGLHPDFIERFWDIFERARDSRKEVLIQEEQIRNVKLVFSN